MSEYKPHSHVPYGEDGSGYYSDNTLGCYNVIQAASAMVMDSVCVEPGQPFVICDYGTADGGTSMVLLRDIIASIRKKYGADQEVHIIYEDQPINDFKSLFLRINGLIPGPDSYLKEFSNVYVTACGTGFYEQCLPNKSVHLGISFTAMHWLCERPCEMPDAIHHTQSSVPEVKAKYAAQTAKDWERILLHRAKELKSGGHLVVVCFAVDDRGQHLGRTERVKESMYATMTKHWRNMVKDGKITQGEFEDTTFNNYYKTIAEYRAPFDSPQSKVSAAGLKLKAIETKVVNCPYHAKWMASGKTAADTSAAQAHAKWFIPTTRTWSNSTFRSALQDSRTDQQKDALVDELYSRYEADVVLAPQDHAMDYVHVYMQMYKA